MKTNLQIRRLVVAAGLCAVLTAAPRLALAQNQELAGTVEIVLSDGRTLAEWILETEELLTTGDNTGALVEATVLGRKVGSIPAVVEIQERAVSNLEKEVRVKIDGPSFPALKSVRQALRRAEQIEAVAGRRPGLSLLKARAHWLLGDYSSEVAAFDYWLQVVPESHPERTCIESARSFAEAAIVQGKRFSDEVGHPPSPIRRGVWNDLHYASALDLRHVVAALLVDATRCKEEAPDTGYATVESGTSGLTDDARRVLHAREGALPDPGATDDALPLTIAIIANAPQAAEELLERGAPLNRNTPLHLAVVGNRPELAKLLINHGAHFNERYLLEAVRSRAFDVAELFIGRGADVDAWIPGKGRLLSIMAKENDIKGAKFLIDRNADVNAKGFSVADTPLWEAVDKKHLYMAKLLIDHGAEVNVQNGWGQTPLHLAARLGYLEIVQLLVDNGADTTAKDDEGYTPSARAFEAGYSRLAFEIVTALFANIVETPGTLGISEGGGGEQR